MSSLSSRPVTANISSVLFTLAMEISARYMLSSSSVSRSSGLCSPRTSSSLSMTLALHSENFPLGASGSNNQHVPEYDQPES